MVMKMLKLVSWVVMFCERICKFRCSSNTLVCTYMSVRCYNSEDRKVILTELTAGMVLKPFQTWWWRHELSKPKIWNIHSDRMQWGFLRLLSTQVWNYNLTFWTLSNSIIRADLYLHGWMPMKNLTLPKLWHPDHSQSKYINSLQYC